MKRYEQIQIITYSDEFLMYMSIGSSQHIETFIYVKNIAFTCIRHHYVQLVLNLNSLSYGKGGNCE